MKITYLGTAAAEGIPALFCKCEYCMGVRARKGREIRSRSQILIDGELSIDFPPDAFYHAAVLGADLSELQYLLVTHTHMDHFYAHDFVLHGHVYAHGLRAPLDIYGGEEVSAVFSECTRRELNPIVKETLRLHTLTPFQEVAFGDYCVFPLKANHTSENPLVYMIEKGGKRILHLSDTGPLPEEDYEYLSQLGGKIDLITFECTYLWNDASSYPRHMGVKENAEVLKRLARLGLVDENTKKVLTHFSHNSTPTNESLLRAEKALGAVAAYDGMEIEI